MPPLMLCEERRHHLQAGCWRNRCRRRKQTVPANGGRNQGGHCTGASSSSGSGASRSECPKAGVGGLNTSGPTDAAAGPSDRLSPAAATPAAGSLHQRRDGQHGEHQLLLKSAQEETGAVDEIQQHDHPTEHERIGDRFQKP